MSLPSLSVKRPVTFFMLFIALVAIGMVAFVGLKIDLLPRLELPVCRGITGRYRNFNYKTHRGAGSYSRESGYFNISVKGRDISCYS